MLQPIAWIVLAAVHVMPAIALFRPAMLTALYGIAADSPLFLLMQHRAALFLAVFTACVWAAFVPEGRRLAVIVTAISMGSFLALYLANGSPPALRRIAMVDLAGVPALALAAFFAFRPVA